MCNSIILDPKHFPRDVSTTAGSLRIRVTLFAAQACGLERILLRSDLVALSQLLSQLVTALSSLWVLHLYNLIHTHTMSHECLKATKFQWSLDVNVMTCQNFRDIRNFLMLRVAKGFNLRLEIVSIRHGWCLWLCLRGSLWLCLGLRLCFRLRRLLLGAWSSLVEPSRHKKYRHPTWNCLNDLECTVWICMNHILQ